MFSDKTLACLRAAGWAEDYHADITLYQQATEADGHPLSASVTAFLTRFGRLKIVYPLDPGKFVEINQRHGRVFLDMVSNFQAGISKTTPHPSEFGYGGGHVRQHEIFFLDGEGGSELREDLEWMAEKIGVDYVCRVGWFRVDGLLLMDLEGRVYLFFGSSKGGSVQFVATSGEKALEMLCSDTQTSTIKSWC